MLNTELQFKMSKGNRSARTLMDDATGAYGLIIGDDVASEVVIYLNDGKVQYFDYRQRLDQSFDPETGIVIELPLLRLTIQGINLLELSHALATRSVSQLIEQHKPSELLAQDEVYIKKIIIENFPRH